MGPKTMRRIGVLLSSLLACLALLCATPLTALAAGTTLHVDASASYTTIPAHGSGQAYKTIQDALTVALSGDTITLDKDVPATTFTTNAPYKIPANMTLTLDLNGHTITATDATTASFYLFENRGDFTVNDSAGGGMISLTSSKAWDTYTESVPVMNQGATLTIAGGTIKSTGDNWTFAVDNLSSQWNAGKATCTISGGTLISSYTPVRTYDYGEGCTSDLSITGGTISSLDTYSPVCLQEGPAHGDTTISISGGTFDAVSLSGTDPELAIIYWNNIPLADSSPTISISGGVFKEALTAVLDYWVPKSDTTENYGSLTVSGGTFESAPVITADKLVTPDKLTVTNNLGKYVLKNFDVLYDYDPPYEAYSGTDCYVVFGGYPPSITTPSLPDGTMYTAYSQIIAAASNDTQPITWGITSGTLPDGLTFDAATGVVSGTPTKVGTWTFTVQATNKLGTDSHDYTIKVAEGAPVTLTYVAGAGGTVSSGSDAGILPVSGTPKGSTATASAGYAFISWTDATGTVVSTSATLVPARGASGTWEAATYTANFKKAAETTVTVHTETVRTTSVQVKSPSVPAMGESGGANYLAALVLLSGISAVAIAGKLRANRR